jgi:hypothetical protein
VCAKSFLIICDIVTGFTLKEKREFYRTFLRVLLLDKTQNPQNDAASDMIRWRFEKPFRDVVINRSALRIRFNTAMVYHKTLSVFYNKFCISKTIYTLQKLVLVGTPQLFFEIEMNVKRNKINNSGLCGYRSTSMIKVQH